jgi:hypothetical protein
MALELFPKEQIVGVFKGFREGGLEFHADLILPYRSEFQNIPMHGQFILVQLETPDEAVLGRITSLSSEGKLSSGAGEEFNLRAMREGRAVPEGLRVDYLKYRIDIRVLGVLRKNNGNLVFCPSHRRLPHVGSPIAFPSTALLQELVGHNLTRAENKEPAGQLGHYALGEFIYGGDSKSLDRLDWMQVKWPEILVRFRIEDLVSRRSFIFARAGFGKSNLNKLLFSELYGGKKVPAVTKAGGRKVPVGTIIFDPDGEYFWPDDKGRPGLCDVPGLEDRLVLFTPRKNPSPFYASFIAGGIKLDVRRLRPGDVIAIALGPDRQDQQNVRKLRGLDSTRWARLVELIHADKNSADLHTICEILSLDPDRQEVEALAARGNMTSIISMLHDPASQLMDRLLYSLSKGRICVVDVSQMRGAQSLILSGLILRRIFDRNQQEFTAAEPQTIPTIAVVEEAQSVLNENSTSAEPYIAWVKEGRKYDLGALLITQQPGSIPAEILSQGDNWFIFHLLSAADLSAVSKANAHFSTDLLSTLLNEPIPGQGVFWSSVGGKPYPVAVRILSFEKSYTVRDPNRKNPPGKTFISTLEKECPTLVAHAPTVAPAPPAGTPAPVGNGNAAAAQVDSNDHAEPEAASSGDILAIIENKAVEALKADQAMLRKIETGVLWKDLNIFILRKAIPPNTDNPWPLAYSLVAKMLNRVLGDQGTAWHSYPDANTKTCVKRGPQPK